ncbi:MAG: N-6 DNA methylase, partial [Candidatus Aminicenantes bacterium]|nr:N-6 DNA methylase [Candidatus Aminicenantes bacterium]
MMGYQQAKENLAKLLDKFERELNAGNIKEYNEEAAKTAFIQPLLKDVLGWDVNNRDEVSPEEKTSRGRVDYGLKIDGKIKIYVEAKPPKSDLSRHFDQAIRYGYNRKGVPLVLLTDFEGIRLFDVTIKPDARNPLKSLKIDLSWREYLKEFDTLWLLSRESAFAGKLEQLLLVKPKERISVDKAILEDLKEWREILAKDIFKNNSALFHSQDRIKDAEYLKEITQKILDRIIFMRSCEDRGFIHRRHLKELFEERTDAVGVGTMVFLGEEFKHYNIIFDSDLFRPQEWESGLAIDFKIMKHIVLESYNPYQFDVIPLEVLGNIYEQYLGYTIRLTDQQVKYEIKPEVRKAGGVYYTPEYIVDYIVKKTVGKMLDESSSKRRIILRILDPACGSGSFLIRAYEELLNYYAVEKKKKFKTEGKQKKLDLGEEGEARLTILEKSDILREHIFGVDIDEQAVEVTKLSLMLKMLEGEYGIVPGRAILPMLDKNIKCGNSLISGNTLELKKYFGDDWYKKKPFNWEDEFPKLIKEEGGFDVVIGNPPYRSLLLGKNTKSEEKEFIEYYKHFLPYSSQYKMNLFGLFIEKCSCLLSPKGQLSFIIPNLFFTSYHFKQLRRHLIEKGSFIKILDLRYKVFEQAEIGGNGVFIFTSIKSMTPRQAAGHQERSFKASCAGPCSNSRWLMIYFRITSLV